MPSSHLILRPLWNFVSRKPLCLQGFARIVIVFDKVRIILAAVTTATDLAVPQAFPVSLVYSAHDAIYRGLAENASELGQRARWKGDCWDEPLSS